MSFFRFLSLFSLFTVLLIAATPAIARTQQNYEYKADNETLPALSDFCNNIDDRIRSLKQIKNETWFLYDQSKESPTNSYDTTYNPRLCQTYANLFLQTCELSSTLQSYRAATCTNGNRLDWNHERNAKDFRPCKATCR
jgi:hypothetical protein